MTATIRSRPAQATGRAPTAPNRPRASARIDQSRRPCPRSSCSWSVARRTPRGRRPATSTGIVVVRPSRSRSTTQRAPGHVVVTASSTSSQRACVDPGAAHEPDAVAVLSEPDDVRPAGEQRTRPRPTPATHARPATRRASHGAARSSDHDRGTRRTAAEPARGPGEHPAIGRPELRRESIVGRHGSDCPRPGLAVANPRLVRARDGRSHSNSPSVREAPMTDRRSEASSGSRRRSTHRVSRAPALGNWRWTVRQRMAAVRDGLARETGAGRRRLAGRPRDARAARAQRTDRPAVDPRARRCWRPPRSSGSASELKRLVSRHQPPPCSGCTTWPTTRWRSSSAARSRHP